MPQLSLGRIARTVSRGAGRVTRAATNVANFGRGVTSGIGQINRGVRALRNLSRFRF